MHWFKKSLPMKCVEKKKKAPPKFPIAFISENRSNFCTINKERGSNLALVLPSEEACGVGSPEPLQRSTTRSRAELLHAVSLSLCSSLCFNVFTVAGADCNRLLQWFHT